MSSDDVRFGYDSVSKRLMSLEKLSPLRALPKKPAKQNVLTKIAAPNERIFFFIHSTNAYVDV